MEGGQPDAWVRSRRIVFYLLSIDMYGMIRGTAADVSFIIDMLPSYLFPNDERVVSLFAVTGKSLGGHAAWQVLTHEPRIRVGVSFIGTPDFQKLLAMRAHNSSLKDVPPTVPGTLRALMRNVDPAAQHYREVGSVNPFFGKKICSCSGADDKLVRFIYSEEFLRHLVVANPGSNEAQNSLEIFVQPNTGHTVTPESAYTNVALTQCLRLVVAGLLSGLLPTKGQ